MNSALRKTEPTWALARLDHRWLPGQGQSPCNGLRCNILRTFRAMCVQRRRARNPKIVHHLAVRTMRPVTAACIIIRGVHDPGMEVQ